LARDADRACDLLVSHLAQTAEFISALTAAPEGEPVAAQAGGR